MLMQLRDGKWVQPETGQTVQSKKDPLTPFGCSHVWGPHRGPIPAVACIPERFYYSCNKCGVSTSSIVRVPFFIKGVEPSQCPRGGDHEYRSDASLGPAYASYEACVKCGKGK